MISDEKKKMLNVAGFSIKNHDEWVFFKINKNNIIRQFFERIFRKFLKLMKHSKFN